MAWNKPDENKVEVERKGGQRNVHHKGLIAGAIVVAFGSAALWIFSGGDTAPTAKVTGKIGRIKDVQPVVTNAATRLSDPLMCPDGVLRSPGRKSACYRDEHGVLRYKNGNARAYDPTRPAREIHVNADARKSPFHFRSEREIARYLIIPPGTTMIGTVPYDESFLADFRHSLEEPIIVTKEDDEFDAQLKRDMIAAKLEILDRVRNGESLKEVLEENRNERNRLALFKRDLESDLLSLTKEDSITEDSLSDFIAAANKMLEQKGLKPLTQTGILKANLRRNLRERSKLK